MLSKSILNSVEKHKGFVYDAITWDDNTPDKTLLVSIRPRRGSKGYCAGCGESGSTYDTLPERRFQFVPLWNIIVFLVYAMRRRTSLKRLTKCVPTRRATSSEREKIPCKGSRWCWLKRPENLTDRQEATLADLVRMNLKTVKSYLLKEDFQNFWEYTYATSAGRFLDTWCFRTMRSKIEPMKKVARMLRAHRALILNWFAAKGAISAGVVEGMNNKVKVTTRKAYGFRSYRAINLALYHNLGDLPEPDLAHRFC